MADVKQAIAKLGSISHQSTNKDRWQPFEGTIDMIIYEWDIVCVRKKGKKKCPCLLKQKTPCSVKMNNIYQCVKCNWSSN